MERKLIAAAVASAVALPMAAQAVEFSVSGHVNRAIISVDGGDNDGDLTHVDAGSSETRFRFTGSEELENGMTAGVNLEYGLTGNVRHANVYLSTAGGKLSVGHTSAATDGMAHARLGGPSWLGGVTNWCSYHSTGPACPSNDGGRHPVLRYDTPAIGPASISVSTGNDDYWDIKLTVAGSVGDAGYDFRIGHIAEYEADVDAVDATVVEMTGEELTDAADDADESLADHYEDNTVYSPDGTENDLSAALTTDSLYHLHTPGTPAGTKDVGDVTTASAAVSFGQGTSIAAAWSQHETNDSEYQYMEIDHSYGDGSIGVYYKRGEKGDTDGSLWGVGIGHSLGGGAHAYAGYRQMSEDGEDDVDLLVAGVRVTFN